jgi:hypothetical protein
MTGSDSFRAGNVRVEIAHVNRTRRFYEWQKDVEAGPRHAVKAAESLDNHHFSLADNLDGFGDDDAADYDGDAEENQSAHLRLREW